MKTFRLLLAAAACAAAALCAPAHAVSVLDIYACYACNTTGNAAIDAALAANPSVASDGLLFAFVNTGASDITNATFSVANASPNDAFAIGTIPVGATVIVMPGLSVDGGTHAPGGLFSNTFSTMDTSDGDGGVSDASIFTFTGTSAGQAVTSGSIVPGDPSLIMTWRDPGATGQTSFIGLGPDGDGGCTNCYFGKIGSGSIAAVPEPSNLSLYLAGLGLLGAAMRRRPGLASAA